MSNRHSDAREQEAIAIVGMALKVPGAQSVDDYWRNLAAGVESIERLDEAALRAAGEEPEVMADPNYVPAAARLDGYDHFDAEFFGFGPKDAAILDPQHRKFLEVCWEAMEQAGRVPSRAGNNVGVFAGCGMGTYFWSNICSNPDLVEDVGTFLLRHTGNDKDFMSTRASHVFDLTGPSLGLQTACSTSLVAVHYACEALRAGQCDMALAGGSTIELPQGRGYVFKENEILSPDGHCHAFDHRAQGTVFGSGAGVVALRRLSDALADGDPIWAVIRGSAVNNDGAAKAGYLAPSVDGQAAAVARAIEDAGIPADTIGYVECHGTGTYLGDPIEVAALTEAFRRSATGKGFCRIGSVKTNIGHLDTAAGVVGLIKASLALHHGAIPPSLNFEASNPAIDFDTSPFRVCDRLTEWPAGDAPRRAGVNSLGVGGTNAHVILEEAPARAASEESDWPFHVLCLSGQNKPALDANAQALAAHLRANPDQPLADVAYTLKTGRAAFAHRRVLVAETHEEAANLLESGDPRRVFTHKPAGSTPDVVFMFPGGGAQYAGMARDLYETEPAFAEWMDRGLKHLQGQIDHDIRALWLPDPQAREAAEAALLQPSVQLPLIMIVEYALAQLWMSWGVRPAALIGHSMGENTAAALAGVMRFEDCIDLVLLRGRLFDRVPPGGMLSVPLPQAELEALIGPDLDIASVNADGLCAVSGPNEALERLQATLAAREIECQRVNIDIAAHSRMLDPILPEFRAFLDRLDLSPPEIPFISNRSGDWITPEEATDPAYWAGQLRHCVRFADGIATLAERPDRVFFEVGPGRALSSLARMHGSVSPDRVLSALRHPDDNIADDKYLLATVGRFWATGVEADWQQVWGEARRNRVVLPTYAFQTARYFIEPGTAQQGAGTPALARSDDIADWGYRPVWQPRFAACDAQTLAASGGDDPQTWLVFADDTGITDAAAQRLTAAGHTVTTVRPGDCFARVGADAYRLAPDQGGEGYAQLMQALAGDGRLPGRILHAWLVTGDETFRPGSDFYTRNMEHGLFSLTHLAQALEAVEHPEQVHITVLTTGAARVTDEAFPYPEKATIAGPAGVIPRELPGVTVATLDIPQRANAPRPGLLSRLRGAATDTPGTMPIDALLEDLLADPATTTAAWRDGRRYEQEWKPAPLPAVGTGDKPVLRDGGTYLITGGLGGIGLSIARDLARRHKANIVLVSRSPLPERAEWQSVLDTHADTHPTARRIRALQEIEALGGTARVERADICDIEQMRQAVDRARAAFGAIHGVIHAAGVIDDAPLLGKEVADIERVLAPKVHGLRVLDALFPDGALDVMILCSSTSTVTRPEGQIDYVAANEYLNAFARARSGGETRVLAIDWGVWAEVGMAARMAAQQAGGDAPDWTPAEAPLIDAVAQDADGTRRARLTLDPGKDWVVDEHRTAAGFAVMPGTGLVELALQSHLATGGALPVELDDMVFLRPLDLPGDTPRMVEIRSRDEGGQTRLEIRGTARVEGREGLVLNAQARLARPAGAPPAPLDIAALDGYCGTPSIHTDTNGFTSPQEAHLAFGPRWRVVREARIGRAEGLARLALPDSARGDRDAGFTLHPAMLDLATGWAMELIEGYTPDRLWVPVGYGRVRVWQVMPAEIISHVSLRPETDGGAGVAAFDVVLAAPDGTIIAEIEDFQMQRLAGTATLESAPITSADDVIFSDGAPTRAPGAADRQMQRMLALGIRPEEGAEALNRALERTDAQIAISPVALGDLIRLADTREPERQSQSFERPQLDADYAAPETETENRLAKLWEGLLGINPIGIHDSFFDLGGHSLLAVRLFAAVKRETGVQLPISVLVEAPTIAALAALIDTRGGRIATAARGDEPEATEQGLRHAVALNGGDKAGRTPLFIVAGMFGNVLNLRHLALLMGDRPVYGLQARGLIGSEAPHETIEEAAAAYIEEMRTIQPKGPYLVGGFSGGGITAYEIAHQLRAQGAEVAMLVMLDTPLPVRPALKPVDKALMKLHDIRRGGPGYLLEWARNRWAWEKAKRARAAGQTQTDDDGGFNNRRIEMAFRGAVARYELRPWDGPLALFRPPLDRHWKVSGGNWVSTEREYVFEDNGWRRWAPALTVIEVPGDHDSMVLTPNVSVLAKHIDSLIHEAETGAPATIGTAPLAAAE
ncbi:type I polyketide synthase [Roseovarius amoyensis]|uniref:type I polyketide synthase n=1 Tax=Roseovarius amoyensis TaxID=2211448 RepID=UPI000DBE3986|nr:type I polyketide synthase [Roseovarius amoyensis]